MQEALIAALLLWRRAPDRERAWHSVRSVWPDTKESEHWAVAIAGELSSPQASAPETRRPSLTRDEVAEMERVGEWLRFVAEQDRRLVVLALAQLAGGRRNVSWARVRARLGAGIGAKGLYRRYSKAIAGIAAALNGGTRT